MWNVQAGPTAGEDRGLTPVPRAIDRNAPYKRIATEEAWNIPEVLEAQVRLLASPNAPDDSSLRMAGMFSKLTTLQDQLMDIGEQRIARMDELGIDKQLLLLTSPGVQVLEPGECFGHPSLLTGMAPAFTIRAREPSVCALLPAEASLRVLGTVAGAAYVATSMRKRLTRTGHTVHGLLDVGTTPVSAIARPAVFCEPEATLRDAARRLGEPEVSALLVAVTDGALGIVTAADVRAGVASDRLSLDAPVRALARSPVPTVPVGQLAVEATVDMLAAGSEHVAVTDGGRIIGVLSATDLLGLDARSPIALRHTILGAADEATLTRAAGHLPHLFRLLMRAGVPPRDIGRVLSLQHDAVVARLIDFSIARHGPAPVAWAWLDLGSAARRER